MNKILVIAAHPDDETLGLGGTIIKLIAEGNIVNVLIITDGVSARHKKKNIQQEAATNACEILGVQMVHFAGLPDQKLDGMALLEIISPIEVLVKQFQPNIIFTHHGGDVNQDHRTLFEATLVAARPTPWTSVKQLLCYETPSSTEWAPALPGWQFSPNVYYDITEFFDKKLKALECYSKTHINEIPEFPHPRSLKAIKILAQQNGFSVGLELAESFMLIREIK